MIKDLILKKHFMNFRDAWQITDKDEAAVFEKFVNCVILSQDEANTFVGNLNLLDVCCTGGGDDAKLDGIGIKINGQLVGSIGDIDQIVTSNKRIDVEFFVIQAKERTDFDSSAVNTFGIGVKNFFSEPLLPENEKVKKLRELKDYIFTEEKVYRKLNTNPTLSIHYVFCGSTPDDPHTEAVKQLLVKGVESCPVTFDSITFDIIDGKQLIEKCKDLENNFSVSLNIRDIIPLTVNQNDLIKKAYAFTCEATELMKLLSKEDATLRRTLFNSNVRDYLGNKGGVNSEIEATVKNDPEMFLMCNNGITIVCSNFIQIKDKLVSIDNPQIVNGCQTCTTLYLQKGSKTIDRVQVLVKLICTEDVCITNKVVRGTNKQNQVLEESFEATKTFHQELEDYFAAKTTPVQLFYERRNKQYSAIPTINRYAIVNLRVLTQSFVATFLQCPYQAHWHESRLLRAFVPSESDRKIYGSHHLPYAYYISSLIWYRFEDAFRRKVLKSSDRTYLAHFYYIIMFLTGKCPLSIESNANALAKYCEALEKVLDAGRFDETVRRVKSAFNRCEQEWLSKGKSPNGMKDTKEFTDELTRICREIFVNKTIKMDKQEIPVTEKWYQGKILSFVNKEPWFAFIKSSSFEDNVYFDKRVYEGDVRKLIPKQECKFLVGSKMIHGEKVFYATKVLMA